jgi:ATP-dependent helicase HrpB
MLEPRRLAARAAAERLASELGEKVGKRWATASAWTARSAPKPASKWSPKASSPPPAGRPGAGRRGPADLRRIHERSLDADLALALSLNGRELLRDEPPLKILLMSATLEGERLSRLLDDAPVVSSEGRMHPVDIRWGRPFQPGEFIEPRVVDSVLQALADQAGSVLVFLPGQAEIRRVHQSLQEAWARARDSAARCMANSTSMPSAPPSTRRPRACARWCWPPTSPRPA